MPWTQRNVAAFLGTSVRTVQRLGVPAGALVLEGAVRPILRYDEDEVRAWWGERVRAAQAARQTGSLPAPLPPVTPLTAPERPPRAKPRIEPARRRREARIDLRRADGKP